MSKRLFKTMVAVLAIAAAATGPARAQSAQAASINVTWTAADIKNATGVAFTINGVTLAAGQMDHHTPMIQNGGTFTTTLGNFTKIEISADYAGDVSGTGWSNDGWQSAIWTGNAASVSFSDNIWGGGMTCDGDNLTIVFTIEPSAPAVPHTVRFAAGNDGWTVTDVDSARSATAPAVLQNVMAGDSLVVTAPATLPGKVKSVKAVKYVAPAATVTTAPTATAALIEANSTTALVDAGAANGGTMMYAVTTTNAQPASTADFSATRPTAEGRAAGTYYVWYYAKADAEHSDSEIAGPVSVTVAEATPALSLTSPAKGQVIGSDGKNYAAGASLPSGVTKVAMIAYVSGSNGLAIALADEGSLNWATAKSTCEAKTPAFTGGTWHLPSQAEWNQMFSANGGDEERCAGLNTAITTAGGTALLEGGTGYWSSTPNGSNVWYVWLMDGDTDWRSGNVNLAKQVRACLAF